MKNQLVLICMSLAYLCSCSSSKSDQGATATLEKPTATSPMTSAAVAFLDGLTPELKQKATFDFDFIQHREEWNFVPLDDRKGIRVGHLDDAQQKLAFEFLKTGLSEKGYTIAREIMDLENILVIKEKQKPGSDYRNPTKYFLSVFGTPSDTEPWGWKYEGHHLSLNYSSISGKLSVTPAFLGSNPAEVDIEHAMKGKRVLGHREDEGRTFMKNLDQDQQQKALVSQEAYPEIVTGTESYAKLEKFEGLSYRDMTEQQQAKLTDLIQLHLNIMKPEVFEEQWNKIVDRGLENLYFAWAGGLEKGQKHYYRIHGPATIIEYDNAQNNGNHAHIVWRDTEDDFGRDLLKEHHQKNKH